MLAAALLLLTLGQNANELKISGPVLFETGKDAVKTESASVLVEVQKTYWDLYRERAVLLQRRKLLAQGRQIYDELDARREVGEYFGLALQDVQDRRGQVGDRMSGWACRCRCR